MAHIEESGLPFDYDMIVIDELCLKHGRVVPVKEVHHIVPLADGGTNEFSNLMSLCKSCHSAITLGETNKKS